jgi:hypothetical protein
MSTVRIGNRDVRVSQEVLDRLKKTPKSQIKTVRDRILKWAKKGVPKAPNTPKSPKNPTRPKDPIPGKSSRKTPDRKAPFHSKIPPHVLFRKQHPIDRR